MTWEPAAKDKRVAVDDKRVDDEDVRQTTTIIGMVRKRQNEMIKQVAENCESGLRAGVCRRQTTDNRQCHALTGKESVNGAKNDDRQRADDRQ